MKVILRFAFLPRLEALRGVAAVSVVGYHAYGMRYDTVVTGMAPVVLFFVLSGFVLARSLENDASALLIYLIAAAEKHSRMFAVLDLKMVRFVGRISYSFYLLHLIGLGLAARWQNQPAISLFVCAVAMTIPLAWTSWRWVEVPFLRFRRARPLDTETSLSKVPA